MSLAGAGILIRRALTPQISAEVSLFFSRVGQQSTLLRGTAEAGNVKISPDVADSPLPVNMRRLEADAAASSIFCRPSCCAALHRFCKYGVRWRKKNYSNFDVF